MASVRCRLMVLVFGSIAVVLSIALAWSYRAATREVGKWDDARLMQVAQMLAMLDQNDLSALSRTHIHARVEYPDDSANSSDEDSDKRPRNVLFQVSDANGHVSGDPELVSLGKWGPASDLESGARTMSLGDRQWHTYTLHDEASGRTVLVLEPSNGRSDLATGVVRRIGRPILLALPVLALLVWISITNSLASLRTVSRAISKRDADKLDPIDTGIAPIEIRPLVDAINQLLSRVSLSMSRERAFTADAAHELKTPLAAIKVQAQVALSALDITQQRLAMQRVVQGVDRSAHLAEQLLLLARLDEHDKIPRSPVILDALARDTIVTNEAEALRKDVSIILVADAHPEVIAEPVLMRILLCNLIDNAIKYGNVGGRVEVAVCGDTKGVHLTVRDNGPGVTADERARLTDRFFRASGTSANGSGLGLSIVARIVESFGAQLRLDNGIDGRGLTVEISFPRCMVANEARN
ncbi:ATP-binding protein [Paraburkholderia fungorum]|uniref:ATP-binding protein n=1 Tax=Paraburkholderia fungorum TaxID=134537 RepID=UPI0038BA5ED3